MREALEAWVDAHTNEIIEQTQNVLRIPSVQDEATVSAAAPFGQAIADALAFTLGICNDFGMKTENFDGYAGHAEFGQGEEIAAMLGHLDVVPIGKGWTHEPWGAEIADGYIWGRGTSDDKGPTFAALFGAAAVKAVTEASGVPLSRRIRLIFGCDEERNWKCMDHYFGAAGQAMPNLAFTPDAEFPLVYAEKGSFTGTVTRETWQDSSADIRLISFHAGQRANMVPDEAIAVLAGAPGALELAAFVLVEMEGITVENHGNTLTVTAKGKAAHGSTPDQGDNAAVKLARALSSNLSALDDLEGDASEWLADLARRGASLDGAANGIACSDEVTGPLTCNLGVVTCENGSVSAQFNVRYPVTQDGEGLLTAFTESVTATGWKVESLPHTPPLYVPQDAEPVKTLLRVYREHTGDNSAPKTMGGRTYATSVSPIGVAFGAAMDGDPETAHQADERFAVERLLQCAKIYAHALYELAK